MIFHAKVHVKDYVRVLFDFSDLPFFLLHQKVSLKQIQYLLLFPLNTKTQFLQNPVDFGLLEILKAQSLVLLELEQNA